MTSLKKPFERELKIDPAYDKRNPDPNKNYGIHGVTMTWYLKGEKGAIQFVLYTNWQQPHVRKEFKMKRGPDHAPNMFHEPLPADLGYHSLTPQYEDQSLMTDHCPVLNGRPCYYDGSSLNDEKPFDILCEKGGEALWEYLEEYYKDRFDDGHNSTEACGSGSTESP